MAENVSSYLTVLLSDNENLKNWLTNYLNVKISLEATYKDSKGNLAELISPEEKKQMIDTIAMFRAFATRIKISINVLKDKFLIDIKNQIEEDYKLIKESTLHNYDVCERYVQYISDMLNSQLNVSATFKAQ